MKYLIIRSNFLGDIVITSTFIKMLKENDPTCQIDFLCCDYTYPIIKYNPDLNAKYYLYPSPKSNQETLHNKEINSKLSSVKYDVVFMLNRNLKSYKLLKYINTKFVFGYRLGVKSIRSKIFCFISGLSTKFNYTPYNDNIHQVKNSANLLQFALNKLNLNKTVHLIPQCYFYTENFDPLNTKQQQDSETIVLNISGKHHASRYITTAMARCIIEDLLGLNKKILLIILPNDMERTTTLLNELNNPDKITLCYETELLKLADIMAKYKYFIGVDGGLVHVAAGLNMRCVALFHQQSLYSWHPWTPYHICLQTKNKWIYDLTASDVIKSLMKLEKHEN